MKQGLILTGTVLLLMLIVPAANADVSEMKMIEGRAGVALPFGDFGDLYDPSITFGGGFMMGFHEAMMFEASLNYTMFSGEMDILGETFDYDTDMLDVTGGIRYFLMPEGMMPYIGAGAGLYYMSPDEGDSETKFGINYGGGLMFNLSETMCLDIGARFNTVFTEDQTSNYLALTGGIAFSFGY